MRTGDRLNRAVLMCGGVLTLMAAAPVAAQAAAPAAPGSGAAPNQVSEVIVTAERRAERLIDVPATISVVSGETLRQASITNTFQLTQAVPGLQVSNTGVFTSFALRGISSETSGPGAENNVSVYVDGVYYPSKSAGVFDFPDVSSIEVLKGPQGTLYGRNATGGAILFKTADPTFATTGKASVSYGSYDEKELRGLISSGFGSDKFAVQLSGFYKKDDGYIKDIVKGGTVGGVESTLIRGKLLFQPTDSVKLVLSAYHAERKDHETMSFTVINGNTNARLVDPNALLPNFGESASDQPNYLIDKTTGASLHADVQTGLGQLTLISGYTKLNNSVVVDGDNSSVNAASFLTVFPEKTFVQEAYLATKKFGRFSAIVGASYYHDVGRFDPVSVLFGGIDVIDIYSKVKTQAFAAYADVTYDVTDQLTINGGVRWSTEKKNLWGAFNNPTPPFIAKRSWHNVSPKLTVRYAVSPELNVYASYTRGFKSGTFNPNSFFVVNAVRPEIVDAFEAGVKGRVGSNLSFELSAFHYDYKDIQVTTFLVGTTALQNAAKEKIYGLDASVTWRPVEDLTLTAAVTPLHARYSSFPSAVVVVPRQPCPGGLSGCGNTNAAADLSGNVPPRAPNISATLTGEYDIHRGNQTFKIYGNLYHSGRFYWEITDRIKEKPYTVLNARLSWNVNNGPLSIELWGRNLTDTKYYVSQGIGTNVDALLSARPVSWGVTLLGAF
jgi:iron complex outermembrane receptor protein